jgi:hypothetical protein
MSSPSLLPGSWSVGSDILPRDSSLLPLTHRHKGFRPLNDLDEFNGCDNMPAKWQMLIMLGQDTISRLQQTPSATRF